MLILNIISGDKLKPNIISGDKLKPNIISGYKPIPNIISSDILNANTKYKKWRYDNTKHFKR